MTVKPLNLNSPTPLDEPAPGSSIRTAAAAEPRISVEIRAATLFEPPRYRAPADEAIGRVIADKYRVERRLGEGAMGVVLAATHVGLDEPVAIKFMRPEVQSVAGTLERFAKEAKIAARIRNEHVAKVLDVGEAEPFGPFIVMEYLEGKSLADLLEARVAERRGPMATERVVDYMLQACEALAAAHAVGVVHRDVKPDNLFVTRHAGVDVLKLLDFGISKAALTSPLAGVAASSTSAFVMGTPLYMSPEQLRALPDIDGRTDVWSIGAVLYELLAESPPFQATSVPEICASILESTPPPLPASCPAALGALVMRCLEKDRERRFQTVAELAAALVPLAPSEARAYASRSSGILRASSLKLDVGGSAAATPARESGSPARAPAQRFQSSALVAAATVLALSALGVTITLRDMRGDTEASPAAVAREAATAAAAEMVAEARVEAAPAAVEPLAAPESPPPATRPLELPLATPADGEASASVSPPASRASGAAPRGEAALPTSGDATAPPSRDTRALERREAPPDQAPRAWARASSRTAARAARVGAARAARVGAARATPPSAAGDTDGARPGRVRLVENRPRPRLVDPLEAAPSGALGGATLIRRVGEDRSAP